MPAEDALDIDGARASLVAWYRRAQRDLPWRRAPWHEDPYAIWVSEIMLQQTRVETVAPRWLRWIARFPTVRSLAAASPDEVMEEWAGLGYYARARNLHAAAREVSERYNGELPDDADAIRALPGIGRYTAGAILSLAFGRRAPILDGNVIRVLTRVARIDGDPKSADVQKHLWTLAAELVADGDPADVNQGLMELGAMVCLPRAPLCLVCPLRDHCAARAAGVVESYPNASRPTLVKEVAQIAVLVTRRKKLLLLRRPPRGLWGGLYEFPTGELRADDHDRARAAVRVAGELTGLTFTSAGATPLVEFDHVLSHRRMRFHGYVVEARAGSVTRATHDAHRWMTPTDVAASGISVATRRLLAALHPHEEHTT